MVWASGCSKTQAASSRSFITVFHYDFDGNIIGESQTDVTFTNEYIYQGSTRLVQANTGSGKLYYYLNNYLGTPLMMTNANNTVVWEAEYQPFGQAKVNPKSKLVNNFRFAGQYYDSETGLHYNYFRYYDPKTGRYLTPDPVGLLGGINLYSYVTNNPINEIDPWGLNPAILFGQGVTASSGLGVGAAGYSQQQDANEQLAGALTRGWQKYIHPPLYATGHYLFAGGTGDWLYDITHRKPDPYDIQKSKRKYKESRQPIDLKYGGQCEEGGDRGPGDDCDKMREWMWSDEFARLPVHKKLFYRMTVWLNCVGKS
jgi:RHS repeat-associated protein